MSSVSTQTETEDIPLTRCTNCHTVFEVSSELLASTDTRVRCGECLCIFDAMDGLRGADENNDTLGEQWLDDTYNEGLLSDSADLSAAHEALAGEVENMAAEQANAVLSVAAESPEVPEHTSLAASTLENAGAAALAGLANDTQPLDVTYSDFDLFSDDANLPEIAYFDQTRDTPEFNFDSVELDEDETFSDTLFSNDVTINADLPLSEEEAASASPVTEPADIDYIADREPKEPLIFDYNGAAEGVESTGSIAERVASGQLGNDSSVSQDTQSTQPSTTVDDVLVPAAAPRGSWTARVFLSLLVLLVLVGLYGYRERQQLITNPALGPVVTFACKYLKCANTVQSDPKLFSYNWRMYSHPNKEGVLVLAGPMRNNSGRTLPFPVLTIKFQNRVGSSVSQMTLKPSEYVKDWDASKTLLNGKHIDITFEVRDENHRIYTFEVM